MSNSLPSTSFAETDVALTPSEKPTELPPAIMVSPGEGESVDASLSLVAIIFTNDTSVRLRNSVIAAAEAGALPFASVGDYLAAGAMAVPIMTREVRHFGAKTARELDLLMKKAGRASYGAAQTVAVVEDHPSLREIVDVLGHLSLGQAIEGELLSARLEKGLAIPEMMSTPFSEVALSLDEFLASLQRRPSIGRTSVKEMAFLVRRLTPRLLAEHGVADSQITQTCNAMFGEEKAGGAATVADDVPSHETLAACLDWLLSQCEQRDRVVVERRFGLGLTSPETLEEIGFDYSVTRERIRQIEKRALKRMRIRMRRVPLADHVTSASEAAWVSISDGRGWITNRQVDVALRNLDGSIQLALELIGTSLHGWLATTATRASYGWVGPPVDPIQVRAAAVELDPFSKLPLPRSFCGHNGADKTPHVEAALRVELGLELDQGYLVQTKPGLRMRRALGLHRILASTTVPLSTERLVSLYHRLCPSDPCSIRDVNIVMQAVPHLFVETFDQFWFGIGTCGSLPTYDLSEEFVLTYQSARGEADADNDGATCAAALIAALERRGPERLLTLYQNAEEILPQGRSPNSVGPTLLTNPQVFVRLLPGVYGLRHQVPSPKDLLYSPPGYLLDNNQLRLLALARRAGERRSVFPLWSVESEFALARWGRLHGAPDNFRSLLAVSNVGEWPISPTERVHWQDIVQRQGRFELSDALRHDAYVRPELDRLLAACIEAANSGELNWMAVNRMAGRRIDSHVGASIMAILLALGAVQNESNDHAAWQRSHRATERAAILGARLVKELSSTGTLDWDRGIGLELKAEIRAAVSVMVGWPEASRIAGMMDSDTNNIGPLEAEAIDPLDAIMAESRYSSEMQRREKLLKWLLEE